VLFATISVLFATISVLFESNRCVGDALMI
jgi:hypothetical protein